MEGCIMTSAPDMDGNRFAVEAVEQAYEALAQKRTLEIMGTQTPLTKVWLTPTPEGDKELWIAWEGPAPRGAESEE